MMTALGITERRVGYVGM